MSSLIRKADLDGPAWRAGLRPGQRLLKINGHPIRDVLDYKFYGYDSRLELEVEQQGHIRRLVVEKEEGRELTARRAAPTNASSALSTNCPRGCVLPSILRMTTLECPFCWAIISP